MTEDNEFQKMAKLIKNLPIACKFCGAKHDIEEIQYIRVYLGRREPVCDKKCAIGYADREITLHLKQVDILKKRVKELTEMN